jgi:hypothetical protein
LNINLNIDNETQDYKIGTLCVWRGMSGRVEGK